MKTETKNPAAVALAHLRRGVKERPSEAKRAAVRANLAKARLTRWPAKSQQSRESNE